MRLVNEFSEGDYYVDDTGKIFVYGGGVWTSAKVDTKRGIVEVELGQPPHGWNDVVIQEVI